MKKKYKKPQKITVNMIMKKEPCEDYTKEKIEKYICKGKTLLEILSMSRIPAQDRIWCVTQFMSDTKNSKFAIWCARQCKTKVKEITDYIDVIEKYYKGKAPKEELRAADWTAYSAAFDAADNVAYRAAYCAACRAADKAAFDAADLATYRAVDAAVYCAAYRAVDWSAYRAARKTTRRKQIKWLKGEFNGD